MWTDRVWCRNSDSYTETSRNGDGREAGCRPRWQQQVSMSA